jgi:hypothetical protein
VPFIFGEGFAQGALGSEYIGFSVVPDNPTQSCTTTFSVTASIADARGVRPYNLKNNPRTSTITVTFRPSQLPPDVNWGWSPHCADPASLSLDFTVTSPLGGRSQVPLASGSCAGFGPGVTSTILDPLTFSPNPSSVVGIAPTPGNLGYRTVTISASPSSYGDAGVVGGPSGTAPIVGITGSTDSSSFWFAAADGGVFSFGNAPFYGSMGGATLNAPIVGMAASPDGHGYWLVAADGGVFGFGAAHFSGSMAAATLSAPIVGMAASPDGLGYWLVAAGGGVFSFGSAKFLGSMGGKPLNAPISGMAASAVGGYWLVATDGGVFSFGSAKFLGSMGGQPLNGPIAGMARTDDGLGYWLVGADKGVFAFGDAPFFGPSSYYPPTP